MNLELPSPAEADSLRTILLIVLGVMILTIPVVCVIVVAKVTAQRKQRLPQNQGNNRTLHEAAGMDPMIMASTTQASFQEPSHSGAPSDHTHAFQRCPGEAGLQSSDHGAVKANPASLSGGESSWSDSGSSPNDASSSDGGGDSGGGGDSSD